MLVSIIDETMPSDAPPYLEPRNMIQAFNTDSAIAMNTPSRPIGRDIKSTTKEVAITELKMRTTTDENLQ
jgi:hypothetical protein